MYVVGAVRSAPALAPHAGRPQCCPVCCPPSTSSTTRSTTSTASTTAPPPAHSRLPPPPVLYKWIIQCRAVVCNNIEVEAGGGRANTDEVSDLLKKEHEGRDTTRPGNKTETGRTHWLRCWAE
nr:uncharacterized protein LOC113826219 [Penaeus vannamei]